MGTKKENKYSKYERVFLWLTRLNYTLPSDAAYKGSDRFLFALSSIINELRDNKIRIVIGSHGHDVEKFKNLTFREGYNDFIDWVPHLDYASLLSYLSLSNAVLFSKFGENLNIFSGIDRDALSIGTITVSSFDKKIIENMYGDVPPYYNAQSTDEIKIAMRDIVNLSDKEFNSLQIKIKKFGKNYLDYKYIIPRYEKLLYETIVKNNNKL